MELPDDVIALIKEYSMPITRPDWRTAPVMSNDRFMDSLWRDKAIWFERDNIFNRIQTNFKPIYNDKLMRRYIMRYQIYLVEN